MYALVIILFNCSKRCVNCSVFYVKKHSICRENIHARQIFNTGEKLCGYSFGLCLSEISHRTLVTLVKNLVKFLFALFGFLDSYSEKGSTSQKNIQLFKRPNYQRAYLCSGRNVTAFGTPGTIRGLTGAVKEPDAG
jgi:hypothetical protein